MSRIPLLALSLLLAAGPVGMAQEPVPLPQVGTRVRISVPCDPGRSAPARAVPAVCRFEGPLAVLTPDSIALGKGGAATGYRTGALQRLEASLGRRSHARLGAGAGLLVGAGASVAVLWSGGSTSRCDRSANQDAMSSGECIGLTALGALAGAGLGAVVGTLVRSERWQDVPLRQLRFGVSRPEGGRFVVGVRIPLSRRAGGASDAFR